MRAFLLDRVSFRDVRLIAGNVRELPSMRVFETRKATGSELFSFLTCLHTTTFALPSIFSPLEMISIKIWETPLSWRAKCSLPVAVRVSKTRVLISPVTSRTRITWSVPIPTRVIATHAMSDAIIRQAKEQSHSCA